MSHKTRRIAVLAAVMAAVGATSIAAAPASAAVTFPTPNFLQCYQEFLTNHACLPFTPSFSAWPVRGTITSTTHNQVAVLPPGSSFTGASEIAVRPVSAGPPLVLDVKGNQLGGKFNPPLPCPSPFDEYPPGCFEPNVDGTQIPSFRTPLEFPAGSGNIQSAGLTLAPVNIVESEINSVPASETTTRCPHPAIGGPESCSHLTVPLEVNEEYEIVGPGKGVGSTVASRCKTVSPVKLALATDLTLIEIAAIGAHFEGSTTIPAFTCNPKAGTNGTSRGDQLTAAVSGPGTYVININPE